MRGGRAAGKADGFGERSRLSAVSTSGGRVDPSLALPARGVAAHRGGAAEAPENTLAAFRHAASQGVHQVEFDVRQSADGALVVIHDASVDRTTDGSGRVAETSLASLRALNAGGTRTPVERIPTLAEALAVLPEDLWINVQVKRGEDIAAEVAEALVAAGRVPQAFVAGGNKAGRSARAVCPELRVCNLARQESRSAYVENAAREGAHFIQFHYLRGPLEPELARRAHAAGMRINFCCAPGVAPSTLEALFAAGVDFVLVDEPQRALEVARGVGIAPLPRPLRADQRAI